MSGRWGVVAYVAYRGFGFLRWIGSFSRSFITARLYYVVCHRAFLGVLEPWEKQGW